MTRILAKYEKKGYAAFLSHRETIRIIERALRRSRAPLAFTEGFNPHPRMSFSPALPLGVSAEAEYLELILEEECDLEEVREEVGRALPEGLRVKELRPLAANMPKLSRWARYGLYRIGGEGKERYLLLSLTGEAQGRLQDALGAMAGEPGEEVRKDRVCRMGLYASRDEVFEDVEGEVYYYDGGKGEIEEIEGEVT